MEKSQKLLLVLMVIALSLLISEYILVPLVQADARIFVVSWFAAMASTILVIATIYISVQNQRTTQATLKVAQDSIDEVRNDRRITFIRAQIEDLYLPLNDLIVSHEPENIDGDNELFKEIRLRRYLAGPQLRQPLDNFISAWIQVEKIRNLRPIYLSKGFPKEEQKQLENDLNKFMAELNVVYPQLRCSAINELSELQNELQNLLAPKKQDD